MKIWRELLGYVKLIVIVVAITLVINNVVLINAKIPSPSMEKTLMVKDRLFGFRLAYGINLNLFGYEISEKFKDPERFDIVIFKYPDDESGMMQNTCVKIEHVTKRFGEDIVLQEVNLSLKTGNVYGIVGNNGSGKTVLMKCICGFLPVTTGTIFVFGKKIGHDVDFPESLGVIIETPGFLTQYTGFKNLEILADMNGRISKADIRIVLKRVGLDPDMKKPVGKYSLGMRQRLGIAQAIMEDPLFLILDEPFNGLDKHGVEEIRELLLDLKAAGKTILLASHNEEDIRILCDHVYEMDGGILRERTA